MQLLALPTVVQFTLWLTLLSLTVTVAMMALLVERHLHWARDRRRQADLQERLAPLVAQLVNADDPAAAAAELQPLVVSLGAPGRAVAGRLLVDVIQRSEPDRQQLLRSALASSGAIALAEQGTRRRAPWRRALACETLGKIGGPSAVPVLLARLEDKRPEVRIAAVHALGEIGSADAAPPLTEAFLGRRCAPSSVLNDALRRLGKEGAAAFERGAGSSDPLVRVSSCFGLAAVAGTATLERENAERRLVSLLADTDAAVRTAAAAALGIVGGEASPPELHAATEDVDVRVRRAAVKALGSFDDRAAVETLLERADDDDRETALRAAEALLGLSDAPRAGAHARAGARDSGVWSVAYARAIAEVTG